MAVENIISNLSGESLENVVTALSSAREELVRVERDISRLEAERGKIAIVPPHTDDIVGAFMRGLDWAAGRFEKTLGWHINNANATKPQAAEQTQAPHGAQVLSLARHRPTEDWAGLFPFGPPAYENTTLSVIAVTFFLRGAIKEELPAMIAKLAPDSARGMKQADRQREFDRIDAKLAKLRDEQQRLEKNLNAFREAITA